MSTMIQVGYYNEYNATGGILLWVQCYRWDTTMGTMLQLGLYFRDETFDR